MSNKIIIGRKDKADFPELKLSNVDIKIDTGAYTSSIHCNQIEEKTIKNKKYVKFNLLDPSYPQYHNKTFKTDQYSQKKIKNSFGKTEKRFVIRTKIILFGNTYPIDLSLSERQEMKYPVLIGRKLLKDKFLVDPSRYNISYKSKQKNFKKTKDKR